MRLRLSVFRSNKKIYGQIIDDQKQETLAAASDKDIEARQKGKTKTEKAFLIGEVLAERALKKGVKKVFFARGKYRYHGRIKALVEGVRKGGLEL